MKRPGLRGCELLQGKAIVGFGGGIFWSQTLLEQLRKRLAMRVLGSAS